MSSNLINFWSKPLNSLTEIFVKKYSVLIAKTCRGSNSVWKIEITSLIRMTLLKLATKNCQNRQLAEFSKSALTKLVKNSRIFKVDFWVINLQHFGTKIRSSSCIIANLCHLVPIYAKIIQNFQIW